MNATAPTRPGPGMHVRQRLRGLDLFWRWVCPYCGAEGRDQLTRTEAEALGAAHACGVGSSDCARGSA